MNPDPQFAQTQELAARLLYGRISRRQFLQRAAALGLSASTVALILAACGGSPAPTATSSAPQPSPTPIPTAQPVIAGQATPARAATASPTAAATATPAAGGQPVRGGKLVIGMAGEPIGLDAGGPSNVNSHTLEMHIYDSLLAMDTSFKIYPWLATSWRLSDDQKSYIFTLRKDVKFHDGTPFNAEAVKFTFDRIPKPETKSTSAIAILGPLYDTSEVLDEYTVAVKFKQPYAPFLGGVTTAFLGIVSPTAARKFGPDFPRNPVGSGPYKFKEWIDKQSTTLVRSPDYAWPCELFKNRGTGYLDEITYRYVPESATRQALLDTGEAQLIDNVPTQNVARVRSNPNQQMLPALRTGGPKMVDLNTKKAPLDSLEVRQALNYAFNREELVRTLFQGVFQAAGAPLSPPTFAYDKSVEGMYPHDPAKAAQLLDQAGWKMGTGGLREKDGQQFKLNCLIGTAEEDNAIAQIMQAQFKPLGIQIDINAIAGTALTTAKQQGQHHIGFKIAVYQDPDILGIYFHTRSIGGFNYTFYEDPELNRLLDEGIATLDAEKRKATYAKIQRLMIEKAILIPIYYLANLTAASARLQGLFHDTAGYYWLYDAWLKA